MWNQLNLGYRTQRTENDENENSGQEKFHDSIWFFPSILFYSLKILAEIMTARNWICGCLDRTGVYALLSLWNLIGFSWYNNIATTENFWIKTAFWCSHSLMKLFCVYCVLLLIKAKICSVTDCLRWKCWRFALPFTKFVYAAI